MFWSKSGFGGKSGVWKKCIEGRIRWIFTWQDPGTRCAGSDGQTDLNISYEGTGGLCPDQNLEAESPVSKGGQTRLEYWICD